jgi:lantibiotic leader peptide-processing serine protease
VGQWQDPDQRVQQASIGSNETFFAAQWAPRSIHAEEAWDAGARGTGARVAVLDGGLNNNHIDLNNSVDEARSTSFVPGFDFNQDAPCGAPVCFSHATHVAGIVAAEDDDVGTIGIAPGATIIGVKVLHAGSGSFGAVISGIVYAATPVGETDGGAGAHIINMSLGVSLPSERDIKVRALRALLDQATTFAHDQGALVVVAAGNGDKHGRGIDHDLGRWTTVPAASAHVVTVSALGPVGFALGATNFARLSSFSNFGSTFIDLSGPGGDFVLPGEALCTVGVVANFPCWAFDMVVSPAGLPGNINYFWAAGTSMSSPAVAGVAALVVGTKGPMDPDDLFAHLVNTADDLGAPGIDPVHGNGRVNAFRAIQ